MDNITISTINQEVYQRFPEVRGIKPRLQKLDKNILLIYEVKVNLSNGKTPNHPVQLNQSIRVVVNQHNQIIKISSSR